MGKRFAIIVVVDGLRADGLACYGNARAETPFLNRLAAESVVFDFAFCLDPTLESFYESALFGIHPAYRHAGKHHGRLRDESRPTFVDSTRHFLYSDDAAASALDLRPFAWSGVQTDVLSESDPRAAMVDAQSFFQGAAKWLGDRFADTTAESAVGWVHASVPARMPWLADAAAETQQTRKAYDAAVTAIDECVQALFTEVTFPEGTHDILFIVVGSRGLALGERDGVGVEPAALHEEWLHVPLIVHRPQCRSEPCRLPQLTSPVDLHVLLSRWSEGKLELSVCNASTSNTPAGEDSANWLLFANERGDCGLRTPGWYLMRPSSVGESSEGDECGSTEALYLKPDDRWEFNEVLDRRPEIAAALGERLDVLLEQAAAGEPLSLPPLPAELVKGG